MTPAMFFDSWSGLGRVLLIGTFAYVALVAVLRVSGSRTLAKFNAFDLVVTVALGSTLATVLLDRSVPLAEGVLALGLLVLLQFAITSLSVRFPRFDALVKNEPALLLYRGEFIDGALRRERVTRDEVMAALRASHVGDAASVAAVVLETDGTLSVVQRQDAPAAAPTLASVPRARE